MDFRNAELQRLSQHVGHDPFKAAALNSFWTTLNYQNITASMPSYPKTSLIEAARHFLASGQVSEASKVYSPQLTPHSLDLAELLQVWSVLNGNKNLLLHVYHNTLSHATVLKGLPAGFQSRITL